jgi:DNA-binding transcriptional LysR family regulator
VKVELRQFEHFVAVAEEGHFSRAAERCHIVRSGLSASIRSLERELGTRLFVRTTHEVRLTDAGEVLLGEARRTLAAADAAREAVRGVGNLLRGTLTLATGQPFGAVDVPALLARFHAAYPAVRIEVVRSIGLEMEERVRSGDVDLALGFLSVQPSEHVWMEVLAEGPMVLACSPDHRLATRASVRIDELRDETFIMVPPKWGKRSAVDEAFEAAGVDRKSRMEVTDRGFFVDLVTAGLGVAVMPGPDLGGRVAGMLQGPYAADEHTGVARKESPIRYLPIEDAPRSTYVMIAPPPDLRSAAASAFISMLDERRSAADYV